MEGQTIFDATEGAIETIPGQEPALSTNSKPRRSQ